MFSTEGYISIIHTGKYIFSLTYINLYNATQYISENTLIYYKKVDITDHEV